MLGHFKPKKKKNPKKKKKKKKNKQTKVRAVPGNCPGSLTDTEKKKKNKQTNKQRSGQCPKTARTDGQTDL
jgi:hypothetical protein